MNEGSLQVVGNVTVLNGIVSNSKFDGSVLYEGTIAPKDAGGDPFAPNFHSYDSDFGHLSYLGNFLIIAFWGIFFTHFNLLCIFLEYLDLRTQFVSRTPSSYVVASPQD